MSPGDWLDALLYAVRRNRWIFRLGSYLAGNFDEEIVEPIFLLGTHGGGLTLLSRMIRRNRAVVSVTGDHRYWSGADEMQNVLWPLLPPELTGIRFKEPPDEVFGTPRGWLYATDRLLPKYRLTGDEATEALGNRFRRILRWLLAWHGKGKERPRFTDKSQVFTVRLSFIEALLEGCDPRFLLVTRDPYAVCYRSATGRAGGLAALGSSISFAEKLDLAAQHWANSMRCALEDGEDVEYFRWIRFEDLLRSPETTLQEVCSFVNLDFDRDMVPRADHQVPAGSRFGDRWHPIRPEVNRKYLEAIEEKDVRIVASRCEELAERFGYPAPV